VVNANCDALGVPEDLSDPSVQLRTRVGGNPDLDAETAKIITAGLVLEDKLVKGLSAAVDYWNIDIDHAIEPIGAGVILSSCYRAASAEERRFCELIERDSYGLVDNIYDNYTNLGGVKTSGLDFDVRYSFPTPVGRFGANLEGSILFNYTQIFADGYEWEFKGNYDAGSKSSVSNGGVYADYKLNAAALWAWDRFNAGVNFRFIPGFIECDTENLCNRPLNPDESRDDIPSRDVENNFTMDIFAGVTLETLIGETSVTAGINNLTDQDPAVVYTGFLATSDASTYDFMGRYFYLRLGQRF
jgi:outer membrane receptor protein involved in Fe transport